MQQRNNKHQSKLFKHKRDQKQYKQIYFTLNKEFRQYPQDVIKEISEFAVGTIKLCNKSSCEEQIIVLYEDKEEYTSATPPHSKAKTLGFKHCRVQNVYWCYKHMDQIIQDRWCFNQGLIDTELRQVRCNDCNGHYYCHDRCSVFSRGKCARCDKKAKVCDKCRFEEGCDPWDRCIGCKEQFCKECLVEINVGKGEYKVCKECFDGTDISCEKCNSTVILGYKGKYISEKYIEGRWSICVDGKCMEWVCLKCSTDGTCTICDEENRWIAKLQENRRIALDKL